LKLSNNFTKNEAFPHKTYVDTLDMKDNLGDRMKNYEGRSQMLLPRRTYTMIRLDGKAFHTYTKNCKKPYDLELIDDMNSTAKYLCRMIQNARMAYVQSDEISIVLTDFDKINTDAWFDGNIQKITGVSASFASAFFNHIRTNKFPENINNAQDSTNQKLDLAFFDSRCWSITECVEVHNYFVWRQKDAIRNSIQMLGRSEYAHGALNKKKCSDILHMLATDKGIDWNDCPNGFKYGRCVIKHEGIWQVIDAPVFTNNTTFINDSIKSAQNLTTQN